MDQTPLTRRAQAVVLQHLGEIEAVRKRKGPSMARLYYDEAIELGQSVESETKGPTDRLNLAKFYGTRGEFLWKEAQATSQGKFTQEAEAALADYRESLRRARPLLGVKETALEVNRHLTRAHVAVGDILDALDDTDFRHDAARGEYQKGLPYARELVKGARELTRGVVGAPLAGALPRERDQARGDALVLFERVGLARLHASPPDLRGAREVYGERLALAIELAHDIGGDRPLAERAAACTDMAYVELFQRRPLQTLAWVRDGLKYCPPENRDLQLQLQLYRAHGYLYSGDQDRAETLYRAYGRRTFSYKKTGIQFARDDLMELDRAGVPPRNRQWIEALFNEIDPSRPPKPGGRAQ